jgi:predicted transcriptional regulator
MEKLKDVYFRKTNLASNDSMTFDQNMLTLLLAIDEDKSVLEISKQVKLEPAVFKECFVKLYKLKLIEKVDKGVEYINAMVLNDIRETLVKLLGPLGEVLMDDAAEQLNAEKSKIPRKNVPEYLMAIANEIPSEKQKREFQKIMLEHIKAMDEKTPRGYLNIKK